MSLDSSTSTKVRQVTLFHTQDFDNPFYIWTSIAVFSLQHQADNYLRIYITTALSSKLHSDILVHCSHTTMWTLLQFFIKFWTTREPIAAFVFQKTNLIGKQSSLTAEISEIRNNNILRDISFQTEPDTEKIQDKLAEG